MLLLPISSQVNGSISSTRLQIQHHPDAGSIKNKFNKQAGHGAAGITRERELMVQEPC